MMSEREEKMRDSYSRYEFRVGTEDVLERRSFGRFEVIRTKLGIMYSTWSGYHIWTEEYAVDMDGKAREKGLHAWLRGLLEEAGRCDDAVYASSPAADGITHKEVFDAMVVMTEANLAYPMTAFIDEERAMRFSIEYMKWLRESAENLQEVLSSSPTSDDDRAVLAEENASAINRDHLEAQARAEGLINENMG